MATDTNWPGHKMRILTRFAVVYITEGQGTYRDETGRRSELEAGDLIVICPGFGHWYAPRRGTVWKHFYVFFDGPVFDAWRAQGLFDEKEPLWRVEPVDYWVSRLQWAVRLIHPDTRSHGPVELCRFQEVLAEMHAHSHGRCDNSDTRQWMTAAQDAICQVPLDRQVDWHRLANSLGMSYEAFRKEFRRRLRVPPGQYRSLYVMKQACELLRGKDLTVEAIAQRLGFCNPYHFSRRFKKLIGLPPSQYRKRLMQELA